MSHKPSPLIHVKPKKLCPVCGEASYSFGGIHPQCSMRQADEERLVQSAASRKSVKADKPLGLSAWQRRCKQCQAVVHVRKTVCECGQILSSTKQK